MSIQLEYTGTLEKFTRAREQANVILRSERFFQMIASRQHPYSESTPPDLAPQRIAECFRNSNLVLTLKHYRRTPSVGGAFDPKYPHTLWLNTRAQRTVCEYAAVLIHECVHALSHHTPGISFSHDGDRPKKNQNTAPYAIQKATLELFCGTPSLTDEQLIAVDTHVGDEESVALT